MRKYNVSFTYSTYSLLYISFCLTPSSQQLSCWTSRQQVLTASLHTISSRRYLLWPNSKTRLSCCPYISRDRTYSAYSIASVSCPLVRLCIMDRGWNCCRILLRRGIGVPRMSTHWITMVNIELKNYNKINIYYLKGHSNVIRLLLLHGLNCPSNSYGSLVILDCNSYYLEKK